MKLCLVIKLLLGHLLANIFCEIVLIPDMALYYVTPGNEQQLKHLNKMRTSDTGFHFIHGMGGVGETVEVLTTPDLAKLYYKELLHHKISLQLQFYPVSIEMYNKEKLPKDEIEKHEITEEELEERKRAHLHPIESMAEPDVFSGVFLKISSPHYPHLDVVQLSTRINSTMGNPMLCIPSKPIPPTEFKGDADTRTQWIFEKTENEGFYILKNKHYPGSYVTWEDNEDSFLVVELRKELQRQYKLDGPMRDDIMFQVVNGDRPREYKISIRGMDGHNIPLGVDPVKRDSTDCLLLRRTTSVQTVDHDPIYFDFKFTRPKSGLTIIGVLDDFTYKRSVDDLFEHCKEEGLVSTITSRSIFNHGEDNLEIDLDDIHERRDKFRMTLDNQPLEAFHEINVPPGLCIGTMASWNNSEEKPDMVPLEEAKGRDTTGKFRYRIMGTIKVPPRSQVDYQVIFGWLENLKLPYNATLTVYGIGDRMTKGELPVVVPKQMINFHYIYETLKEKGFNFKGGAGDPEDLTITSYTLPVTGNIVAKSIGVKGHIQMQVIPYPVRDENATLSCQ